MRNDPIAACVGMALSCLVAIPLWVLIIAAALWLFGAGG